MQKKETMHLDRYAALSNTTHSTYEFLSAGTRGTIKKVVQYTQLKPGVYNLAFGDWDEVHQEIKDDTRTNNGDRDKVLATVAATTLDFLTHHPGATVFAQGSTPAKTRLYQMGIAKHWDAIHEFLDVNGYTEDGWDSFQAKKNYEAFTVKAK